MSALQQPTLFDLGAYERICAFWAAHHPRYKAHLQELALAIARRQGTVDIDDVREEMERFKVPFPREIGADDRFFGPLLSSCPGLRAAGMHLSRRADWVARVGKNRGMISFYQLRDAV